MENLVSTLGEVLGSLWTRLLRIVGIVMKLKERLSVWKDIYV